MDLDATALYLATRSDKDFADARDRGLKVELFTTGKEAWAYVVQFREQHKEFPAASSLFDRYGVEVVAPAEPTALSFVVEQMVARARSRTLHRGLSEVADLAEQGDDVAAIERIMSLASELLAHTSADTRAHSLAEIADLVWDRYMELKAGVKVGVPFPWETMTRMTQGMMPGTLTMFTARPGVGKTWMVVIIAMVCWKLGLKVLIVEPEIDRIELGERLVSYEGKIPYAQLISGSLTTHLGADGRGMEGQLRKTVDGIKSVADRFWVLDDEERLTDSSIEQVIASLDPDVVLFDSIYMMKVVDGGKGGKGGKGRGGGDRYERILGTLDWLRTLSRRTKKPFVLISQLSRDAKMKGGDRERMKAGQGTGGLEDAMAMTDTILWDVHNLFALYQDDDMREDKQMLVVPLKVRRRVAMSHLVVRWDMESMDFPEIGTKVVSTKRDEFGDGGGAW
jgi:replicative DNA helicase